MKKNQKLNIFFLMCVAMQSVLAKEVGRYDGGEYYRIKGSSLERSGNTESDDEGLDPSVNMWQTDDMDFTMVRNFFPILKTLVHDVPVVYCDSASTAQMPIPVLNAIVDYYQIYKSNVGRGLYDFAERSTQAFEDARAKVAHFIGAQKKEIVFTSGATASINLVVHIWAQHYIQAGDEIVISEIEHNANFIPWQQLTQRKGATLKIVPINDRGVVDVEIFKSYLSDKTKLVAITHQSNILGTVNDVAAIVQAAHSVGAKVLVDAAQSIAHQKIDVKQIQCDFLVFSGHKLFGPTGVGVLFLSEKMFSQCVLENFGGGMAHIITPDYIEFKCIPYCLEPGTQPIAQVIGLGAAIDFIWQYINFAQVQQHETALVGKFAKALQQIPEITIISHVPGVGEHNNLITFSHSRLDAYDIACDLNDYGIAVRAGYHCVPVYHEKLGVNSSIRFSFTMYNTEQEVDFIIECLHKILG